MSDGATTPVSVFASMCFSLDTEGKQLAGQARVPLDSKFPSRPSGQRLSRPTLSANFSLVRFVPRELHTAMNGKAREQIGVVAGKEQGGRILTPSIRL